MATVALALAACSQFELRDNRFYYWAFWNFAVQEGLTDIDSEVNVHAVSLLHSARNSAAMVRHAPDSAEGLLLGEAGSLTRMRVSP
jgi:hypothetical protein